MDPGQLVSQTRQSEGFSRLSIHGHLHTEKLPGCLVGQDPMAKKEKRKKKGTRKRVRAISELCRCGEIDEVKNQEEWFRYEPVFYSRLTSMDFTEKYAMYLFTKIISFEAKID